MYPKQTIAIFFALLVVAGIYHGENQLIRAEVKKQHAIYAPISLQADGDESEIYAPQVREVMEGRSASRDPFLYEHQNDPTMLAPLAPLVLGIVARLTGIGPVWFYADGFFALILFALFFCCAFLITRNAWVSVLASLALIFFRDIATFFPPLSLSEYKTYFSQFFPTVLSGIYNTPLPFARLFSPSFTTVLVTLFTLAVLHGLQQEKKLSWIMAGMMYGLTFYSYPYDWLTLSFILGALFVLAGVGQKKLLAQNLAIAIFLGLALSIPYWLQQIALHRLPQYYELIGRTGLEFGRIFRWSMWPRYAVWAAAGYALYQERKKAPLALFGCAVFGAAFITMNVQLLTGYVPQYWHFLKYSLSVPMWASYLLLGQIIYAKLPSRLLVHRGIPWMVGGALVASILIRNVQIPFGYAEQNWDHFAFTHEMDQSLAWIKQHLHDDDVIVSPVTETNTHVSIYTKTRVFVPPTGVVTPASNKELVERFVIAAKLFGASDEWVHQRFTEEAMAVILHYGIYQTTINGSMTINPEATKRMEALLDETLTVWQEDPMALRSRYRMTHLFVGPAERSTIGWNPSAAECLTEEYDQGDIAIYRLCSP